MKKFLPLLMICVLLSSACRKGFLDTVPDNITTLRDIFTNRSMTEQWLARCYYPIPDIWDQPYNNAWSGQCDELDYAWSQLGINSGAITPDNASPNHWGSYYQAIRMCGVFIQQADQNEEIKQQLNGPQLLIQYKAEARFLRAYFYWLLMKQYGPLVLMGEEPRTPEDNFQIPRSTWDECVAYVLAEMDKAYPDVPMQHMNSSGSEVDNTQTGRITKPVILAVKSQILLFHASPLFNGNTELADFKNPDGTILINQANDRERWKAAADAAKAVIDLNRHELFKVTNADPFQAAFLSYRNLFFEGYTKEGIWIRSNTNNGQWERHTCPRASNGNAWNGIAVTQEMVDAFRTSDGKAITDPTATYSETGFTTTGNSFYVAGTYNMYVGREPRFYVNVTFNGSVVPVVPEAGRTHVEFFFTGNSGKRGAARDWPSTGYTARKNVHPTSDFRNNRSVSRPGMMIRLAEIYLNYAEALNEYSAGAADVLTYLNRVRVRAGMPELTGGTQEELRKQIRLERQLELMFEGHRYWDVRRWKVPEQPESHQGGQFHGMNIEGGTFLSDPEFHKRSVVFTRAAWERKFYFYPVPQSEIDRNKQLKQFPGY